jgi:hypothetical protein
MRTNPSVLRQNSTSVALASALLLTVIPALNLVFRPFEFGIRKCLKGMSAHPITS